MKPDLLIIFDDRSASGAPGVRPSPGAATWEVRPAWENDHAFNPSDLAAPGDGRTPQGRHSTAAGLPQLADFICAPLRPSAVKTSSLARAFSLIEIMLVMVLLSLIMLALMAVFNSTQTAFRASVTQTDVLEGGRATMDMMMSDFRLMAPSGGGNISASTFNLTLPPELSPFNVPLVPVNFWLSPPQVTVNQSLVGVSGSQYRTNQVQSFFILSFQNQVWHGVGYFVDTNSTSYIYPLYRYDSFSFFTNSRPVPYQIFTNFMSVFNPAYQTISDNNANIHHLLDGVVHLNVRAYDTNGVVLTNGYGFDQPMTIRNTSFYYPANGEVSMLMCSNTLPAAVEIQMAVMEDRTLSRARSFGLNSPLNYSNYLSQQAGKLHLFRQRVNIPNADPASYQP